MSDEVISLNDVRSQKSGDCRDWTVREALQSALDLIDKGEESPEMVYVCMRETKEENGERLAYYGWRSAGGSKIELAGLLSRHLDKLWHDE